MTGDDPLLTVRDVAAVLGVATETVLRWIRRGVLPAIRLPHGALRVRRADLDEWLDGHRVMRGAATRGGDCQPGRRARAEATPLPSEATASPPRSAATTEETT